MRTLLISFLLLFYISFDLLSQIPTYVPTNGLVAYYPFNGNANDISGYNHHGNVNGATLSPDRNGNSNKAYSFDGVNDWIGLPNIIPVHTGSISYWFKTLGSTDSQILVYHSSTEDNGFGTINPALQTHTGINQGSKHVLFFENSSNGGIEGWSPNSLVLNTWYHIVVTYQTPVIAKIYINGSLAHTLNLVTEGGNYQPLYTYIGRPFWNERFFKGTFDDFGIWNRVLTPCEISALYNSTPNPASIDYLQDSVFSCNSPISIQPTSTFTNYSWSTGSTSSTITAATTGWYKCTVTSSNFCSYSDSTFVSIIDASLNQNDTTICIGDSMDLSISQNSTFSPCSSTALPPNLQNGLLAYYPFCGNTLDASGHGLNGITNSASLTTDRFGNQASALYFDGNDTMNVYHNGALTFNANQDFSIAGWFNLNEYDSITGNIIFSHKNVWFNGYFLSVKHGSQKLYSQVEGISDINTFYFESQNEIELDNWCHYCIQYQAYNRKISLFVNGYLDSYLFCDSTLSGTFGLPSIPFSLGKQVTASTLNYWKGKQDDISIWNRVLSPSEIQQLYQNSLTYSWSTGDSTSSISVIPDSTTTYYCTISNGYHSCIDSVTITVSNPTLEFAIDSITFCEGDQAYVEADLGWTSYLWNDSTSTPTLITSTVGIYTLTVTNVYGCAAIDSIVVLVNPLPQIGLADTVDICFGSSTELNAGAGFSSYEWSDDSSNPIIPVSSGGFFAVTVVDTNGCSNSDSTFIQVYAIPELNLGNDTSICNGQTAFFDAGLGQYAYIWSTGATSQGITTSIGGFYSVTITDANFCQNSDSVLVLVNSLPIIHLGEDQSICIGDFTTLNAGLFNSFQWSTGETSQQIQVYSGDTYVVTVTDGNGCQGIDSINVTVNPLPILDIGNDTSICQGNSILLNAGTFSHYLWSTGETSSSIIVSLSDLYSVTVTGSNGCQNSDSIEITINPLPLLNLGNDTSICQGNSISMNAGTFSHYLWSTGETSSSIIVNLTDSYSVTVANSNGCQNSDSIEITINPLPLLNLGNDTSICEGSSLQLYAGTFDSYLWSTGDTSSSIISGISNNYLVTVTDSNGCQNSDEIVLIINALPTVSLGNDINACEDESISISAGSGFALYNWSTGESTQSISPSSTANYSVTVTDSNGCNGHDDIVIEFLPYPTILFQPQDQTVYLTDNAYFTFTAAPISQLQWQTDLGLGFINLSNSGQYSGVTTNTLTVSNCTSANNNQLFRCIVTNWQCSDTSSIAILGVRNEIGVVEFDDSVVKIYPNPVQDEVFIEVERVLLSEKIQFILYNSLGQNVLEGEITEETTQISVSSLPAGVYHLDVISKNGKSLKSKRIVITQ